MCHLKKATLGLVLLGALAVTSTRATSVGLSLPSPSVAVGDSFDVLVTAEDLFEGHGVGEELIQLAFDVGITPGAAVLTGVVLTPELPAGSYDDYSGVSSDVEGFAITPFSNLVNGSIQGC